MAWQDDPVVSSWQNDPIVEEERKPQLPPRQLGPIENAARPLLAIANQLYGGYAKQIPAIGQGLREPIYGTEQFLSKALQAAAPAGSAAEQWAGQHANTVADRFYAAQPKLDQIPGGAFAQGFGASLGPGMVMGALNPATTMLGRAAQSGGIGAGQGAMSPVPSNQPYWATKAAQIGIGAGAGAATSGAVDAFGRMLSPKPSVDVQAMINEKIPLTIGQRLGGMAKSIEDKLTSFLGPGDLVYWNRKQGLDEFNRAIYNRILAPIGETYTGPVGQKALASVAKSASGAYERVLDQAVPAPITPEFDAALNQIASMVPLTRRADFADYIQSQVRARVTEGGTLTPSVAKSIDSALNSRGSGYVGSLSEDERLLGTAYKQAAAEVRALFARANPTLKEPMDAANAAWMQLVQLEKAAKGPSVAKRGGVITPFQYLRGIEKTDSSLRDTKFIRGEMRNQDFAQAAEKVLPSNYPDSGTPGRLALGALLSGGTGLVAPGMLAATAVPYLPGVRRGVSALLTSRPDLLRRLGDPLEGMGQYLGPPLTGGLLSYYGGQP